jgi:hypothetical protein
MDYKQKYFKYKDKYLKLKKSQEGGRDAFILADVIVHNT